MRQSLLLQSGKGYRRKEIDRFMAGIRETKIRCSFCNKTEDQVRKLISGPNGVYICDNCVEICTEILEDEFGRYDKEAIFEDGYINLLKPEEIRSILDDYVIG